MPRTPIRLALTPLPLGTEMVRLSPEDRMRPLVVDTDTRQLHEMLQAAAVNYHRRPMVIILLDDIDLGAPPDAGDLNNEEISRILQEMCAERPLHIRQGTFEE